MTSVAPSGGREIFTPGAVSKAPSPAVAPPPGNPRFPLFDAVRAIAIMTVVLYHVSLVTGDVNTSGFGDLIVVADTKALDLLYLTSAFLLYRPFVRARAKGLPVPSTGKFLRRRVLRIVPGYWIALTLLAIFPGIVGVFSGDWWRYYFFLQLYSGRTVGQGIPAAWTLCIEMTFYFSLPVWVLLVHRGPLRDRRGSWLRTELIGLCLIALFGIAVQVAASRQHISQLAGESLLGTCTWFALGMIIALVSVWVHERESEPRVLRELARRPGACWALAAACLVGSTLILHPGGLLRVVQSLSMKRPYPQTLSDIALTFGFLFFFVLPVVFGDQRAGVPRRILGWGPLMWFGVVSYGVYLYNLFVALLLGRHSDPGHFSATGLGLASHIHFAATPIFMVATTCFTLLIAVASYHWVELPFLRRKEGWRRRVNSRV